MGRPSIRWEQAWRGLGGKAWGGVWLAEGGLSRGGQLQVQQAGPGVWVQDCCVSQPNAATSLPRPVFCVLCRPAHRGHEKCTAPHPGSLGGVLLLENPGRARAAPEKANSPADCHWLGYLAAAAQALQ